MPDNQLEFHSAYGKRRILIVEDELINQEMLKIVLDDVYDIISAETGAEALARLAEGSETISLVLLDLNLPDMHGLEVLKQMKADSRSARIPVIVMTAEKDAEVESLTLGAIDFIPKPYPQPKVIHARVLRTIELCEDRDIIRSTERDHLTGLYNREYFYRYAAQYDVYHKDQPTDAIVLDINHFHIINERYGKNYADEILKRIGERLMEALGASGGIVCRREADTFLAYCPHRSDYTEILEKASVTLRGDGRNENRVRLRMGVYASVDKSIDIERRFDRAKLAADTVKNSFTKAIGIYDDSLHESEIFAEQLLDHLARGRRGQTPEVVRGVVILLAELWRGVRIVFSGLLRDLVLRPDGECAGTRVQFDARVLRCMRCFQIRETQCFRQRLVHGFGIDFLLASELVNAVQVQFHDVDLLF